MIYQYAPSYSKGLTQSHGEPLFENKITEINGLQLSPTKSKSYINYNYKVVLDDLSNDTSVCRQWYPYTKYPIQSFVSIVFIPLQVEAMLYVMF